MTHEAIRPVLDEFVILIQGRTEPAGDAEHVAESPIAPQVQSDARKI